jgi:hypothetical protein
MSNVEVGALASTCNDSYPVSTPSAIGEVDVTTFLGKNHRFYMSHTTPDPPPRQESYGSVDAVQCNSPVHATLHLTSAHPRVRTPIVVLRRAAS